jgi:hypothetical protein
VKRFVIGVCGGFQGGRALRKATKEGDCHQTAAYTPGHAQQLLEYAHNFSNTPYSPQSPTDTTPQIPDTGDKNAEPTDGTY